ncbi:hypothetical protein ACFPIJ_56180 [Dactylosporangium cerinum]|uniref:Response regulatory domain-containing protein n=1 Tax=Dactylosporangium cerinum TaxID=1434730 RepID=A0ABV9WHT3_9ACTN
MTEPTPPAVAVVGQPRLLLVEDDPQLSEMLVDLLGKAGHAVDHAPDGQAGLHLGLSLWVPKTPSMRCDLPVLGYG